MKWFDKIIKDESLNDLQKALYCRCEMIAKLARAGYSDFAIARYFCVNPKLVRRTLKDSKAIPNNRVTKKDELEKLLQERNGILRENHNKSILRHGFLPEDNMVLVDNIYKELYAYYWTIGDMVSYLCEVEGEIVSEYNIRKKTLKEKKTWPRNVVHVQALLEKRYNACDIIKYLAVPEHVFDVVKEAFYKGCIPCVEGDKISKVEKKAAKQEWIRLKSKERVEKVYYYRVNAKISEGETARRLNVSRATVHNDLKRYFAEHPELKDEYCEKGKRRRYYK